MPGAAGEDESAPMSPAAAGSPSLHVPESRSPAVPAATPSSGLPAVGLAAAAAVASSTAWYTAFGRRLARLDEVYATDAPPPPWLPPVEFARSAVVAAAVRGLAVRTGATSPADAARLAGALWVAFPGVLLTGSVVHEKVPWQQAAIHAGDWLVKLLLVSLVATRGTRRS
jgi:hypothetical protein